MIDRDKPWGVSLDDDLRAFFEFHPAGGPSVRENETPVEWAIDAEYGEPPFIFKPVRQNGSRVRLRLLRPDGSYARFSDDDRYCPNELIERMAYSSDLRRGRFWTKVESEVAA
jgi:hypothetical protein